ncbi:hypothetical protein MPER_00924 [Moniliophthora perniciosa FA553]|nr:hypothetical protein MPER_00924 [Moniliophthora perniciosa FA553]
MILLSVSFLLAHSIAATHAYTTYHDQKFLDWAELAWSGGRSYTLSERALQSKEIFGKNVSMQEACGEFTMAGGTFWVDHHLICKTILTDAVISKIFPTRDM